MKIFKNSLLMFLSVCVMVSSFFIPKLFVEAVTETQILVANSANRSDWDQASDREDYWNDYYVSGGQSTSWLWTTFSDDAVFRFDLEDTATTFEPVFVGEDHVGTFKIYGSKDNSNWSVVAEMTSTYTHSAIYNSTTGLTFGAPADLKTTAGLAYDSLNQTNIDAILADNPTKTVYLRIGDIVNATPDEWGHRIQLRYFGITAEYTEVPPVSDDYILVGNSANRSDWTPVTDRLDYWNRYYVSGGEATSWLWTTKNSEQAIFKFDLEDSATTFEPVFVGEDYVGTFKIYGSKDNTNWSVVAEMTETYTWGAVYSSTNGLLFGDTSDPKVTEARSFSVLNQENIDLILADNATKTVYLKIGDIVSDDPDEWGDRIQLRYFGITYQSPNAPVDPYNHGIKVANSANRSDFDKNDTKSDYWNNYYVSGGAAVYWLWKTMETDPAVFRFNLPDATVGFEPYFEGEDTPQAFTIYASKNQENWLPVAEMEGVYEKNRIYNSTSGLSTGDYATGEKSTGGRAFDVVYPVNVAAIVNDNPSKVVYLKVAGIPEASEIQLRAFGITYSFTGEDDPGADDDYVEPPPKTYPDPYDDNEDYTLKTEFRVVVDADGTTPPEYDDDIPVVNESEVISGEAGGTITNGNRLLIGAEQVVYTFEIDPRAVFIKLDLWDANVIDEHDGSQLFSIAVYGDAAEDFVAVCDGGYVNEKAGNPFFPPIMRWNQFDNTWGRSGNNEYYVTEAPIDPETGKKVVQIRLNGRFNNSYDGVLFYKSFVVQTVVPLAAGPDESSSEESSDEESSDVTSESEDSPSTGDNTGVAAVIALLVTLAAVAVVAKRRKISTAA